MFIKKSVSEASDVAEAPETDTLVEDTPAPETPKTKSKDGVFATLKHGIHVIQLIKHTSPEQYIPFLMKCSCGTEGRFHTEAALRDFATNHMNRRPAHSR